MSTGDETTRLGTPPPAEVVSGIPIGWYWRRARQMSAGELSGRTLDQLRQLRWAASQVRPGEPFPVAPPSMRVRPICLPPRLATPAAATGALIALAEHIADGKWETLGARRDDLAAPDWFADPVTGRRAPHDRLCFRINHRSERETGNVKQVWELSRHHHLTVLAAAWYVTGDPRYPAIIERHLRDWWRQSPFLSGVHWTSGIELGIRLISWTWVRRLLDGWTRVTDLFDHNDDFVLQLHWHQRYLAAFRSSGTSANNHAIAEAAGQLVASCAFPWFDESRRWRETAADRLGRVLERNTFPSGVDREQATAYHGFVAELGLLAACEAAAAGHPLAADTWARLQRMFDAAAAMVDQALRPPRQGDGDDGTALLVDGQPRRRDGTWEPILAAGDAVIGRAPWWPEAAGDVRSALLAGLAEVGNLPRPPTGAPRPQRRPPGFEDAGLTILRATASQSRQEIWCRCDAGPHGFLAIAAHAHADALSVELRHGGIDVLADPGTYCYHGEPEWRGYFRSTIAHNTLELGAVDQSRSGGPFLWDRHAVAHRLAADPPGETDRDLDVIIWAAEHYGYTVLDPPAIHRRVVRLDRHRRRLEIVDTVTSTGPHPCRLAFHLGPEVRSLLDGCTASLGWTSCDGPVTATMRLPEQLRWTCHRGEVGPILGWYSPGFGRKVSAVTLVGSGYCGSDLPGAHDLVTVLRFSKSGST